MDFIYLSKVDFSVKILEHELLKNIQIRSPSNSASTSRILKQIDEVMIGDKIVQIFSWQRIFKNWLYVKSAFQKLISQENFWYMNYQEIPKGCLILKRVILNGSNG